MIDDIKRMAEKYAHCIPHAVVICCLILPQFAAENFRLLQQHLVIPTPVIGAINLLVTDVVLPAGCVVMIGVLAYLLSDERKG